MTFRFAPFVAVVALAVLAGQAAAQDTYKVDPVHSSFIFRSNHANIGHVWGRFNEFGGTFVLDEADPSKTAFSLEIKTASVDTGNAKRDAHLQSPDFFNAKQHPTATFKSTAVKTAADGQYEVTGDLALHGVTRAITVPLRVVGRGQFPEGVDRVGLSATIELKLSDFEIKGVPGAVGDQIQLIVSLEGTKEKK